jgi:predicted regulator of Ras-like GTPase activity (Roadblock/LC7/MglB family)
MLDSTLALDETTYKSLSELCDSFIDQSRAACALLVGQDGMLLHKSGSEAGCDAESLSALSAGTFASTREMARLIGEANFDVVTQQGRKHHLELIRVGDRAILVAVFDDRTTAGMVRLHGQRAARRLARLLAKTEGGPAEPEQAWTEILGEEVAPAEDGRGLAAPDGHPIAGAEQIGTALRMRTASLVIALLAAALALVGALVNR